MSVYFGSLIRLKNSIENTNERELLDRLAEIENDCLTLSLYHLEEKGDNLVIEFRRIISSFSPEVQEKLKDEILGIFISVEKYESAVKQKRDKEEVEEEKKRKKAEAEKAKKDKLKSILKNPDSRYYVLVYVGESADESMFHRRGVGNWDFVQEQFKKPPTPEQLKFMEDEEEKDNPSPFDELICGEDIYYCLPERFDCIVEIYPGKKAYYILTETVPKWEEFYRHGPFKFSPQGQEEK